MNTPLAKVLHQVTHHDRDEAGYTFYLSTLRKYPEMLNEVLSLYGTYNELETADMANNLAAQENKLDTLILESRAANAHVSAIENEHLEAMRRHANAQATVTNRNNELSERRFELEHSHGLLTRAELAEREKRVAEAQQAAAKAEMAESQEVNKLQLAYRALNEARAAAAGALSAARQCKAEIEQLKGGKPN
jgi:hypothetical protein